MPNNGIVSTKTNIPDKFRAESTSEFNTATDMVVVNKALDGINVTQKSVTIDQLGGLVSNSALGYKSIVMKIRTTSGGNFSSLPVFSIINTIYDDSTLTYSLGTSMIATNVSTQCIVPINFTTTFNTAKIYATGISNSAAQPLDIIASVADNDTIYYHIKQMDDPLEPIDVPAGFQFSVEIRIYN